MTVEVKQLAQAWRPPVRLRVSCAAAKPGGKLQQHAGLRPARWLVMDGGAGGRRSIEALLHTPRLGGGRDGA